MRMRRSSSSANLWSIISSRRASFASNIFSKSPNRLLKSLKRLLISVNRLFISVLRSVIRLLLYRKPITTAARVPTNVAMGINICKSVTDEVPISSVCELPASLNRNAFGEITRLVNVAAAPDGDVIGKQLQGDHLQ